MAGVAKRLRLPALRDCSTWAGIAGLSWDGNSSGRRAQSLARLATRLRQGRKKDGKDIKDEKDWGFRDPFGEGYGLSDFCNVMSVLGLRSRRWARCGGFRFGGVGAVCDNEADAKVHSGEKVKGDDAGRHGAELSCESATRFEMDVVGGKRRRPGAAILRQIRRMMLC